MAREVVDNIGEIVRAARKGRGLSQEALAYDVGLEQTEISKIERGKEKPNAKRTIKLAEVLGLDPDELFS